MPITETGYHRPTYEEILDEVTLKAQELFGEDIDTGDQTPLGKIIRILAYVRGKDHELAELIYYSRFPNTATGTNLDRLCPFVGIARNVATPARYNVIVTGKEGTTIPIGFLVATESGIEFYNTAETTIEAGQTTCTILVEAVQAGTMGNVVATDIVEVVNPTAGVDSVLGSSIVAIAEDEESDYDLRQRILIVGEGSGTGNEASIRGALMRVPTVTSASVIVNDSNEVDSYGNPPHSISCYVSGGADYVQQIGEAIFNTKPVGIGTNGDKSVEIMDEGGFFHTVRYSTIQNVAINVTIEIETTVDFEGERAIDKIKANVEDYIDKLAIGDDVILSALYGHIYSVGGVSRVATLKLNGGTADISISTLQCANCATVTVAEV